MTDGRPTVVVLADDLIWSTRLTSIVERNEATARVAGTAEQFDEVLRGAAGAVVDLSARTADPIEAIGSAAARGIPVVAVGPHEDRATRQRALAAGAARVFAYRKVYEDGPRSIGQALGLAGPAGRTVEDPGRPAAPTIAG